MPKISTCQYEDTRRWHPSCVRCDYSCLVFCWHILKSRCWFMADTSHPCLEMLSKTLWDYCQMTSVIWGTKLQSHSIVTFDRQLIALTWTRSALYANGIVGTMTEWSRTTRSQERDPRNWNSAANTRSLCGVSTRLTCGVLDRPIGERQNTVLCDTSSLFSLVLLLGKELALSSPLSILCPLTYSTLCVSILNTL